MGKRGKIKDVCVGVLLALAASSVNAQTAADVFDLSTKTAIGSLAGTLSRFSQEDLWYNDKYVQYQGDIVKCSEAREYVVASISGGDDYYTAKLRPGKFAYGVHTPDHDVILALNVVENNVIQAEITILHESMHHYGYSDGNDKDSIPYIVPACFSNFNVDPDHPVLHDIETPPDDDDDTEDSNSGGEGEGGGGGSDDDWTDDDNNSRGEGGEEEGEEEEGGGGTVEAGEVKPVCMPQSEIDRTGGTATIPACEDMEDDDTGDTG